MRFVWVVYRPNSNCQSINFWQWNWFTNKVQCVHVTLRIVRKKHIQQNAIQSHRTIVEPQIYSFNSIELENLLYRNADSPVLGPASHSHMPNNPLSIRCQCKWHLELIHHTICHPSYWRNQSGHTSCLSGAVEGQPFILCDKLVFLLISLCLDFLPQLRFDNWIVIVVLNETTWKQSSLSHLK